ncbi:enoyl-CoA hydratase-related protein [Rhodococcus sp. T7]|uniref:enoyl-CoA hydratase-related protein n=1 Tax=Rhodococcus sp. T7 TaxID=627444 RepID=UPI001356C315|nr:enoyl-CoA hydratase-related protein [Rhodococcus sp. T7]KAF0957253.1 putative enoyl-CoA hydratase echA12 [Rhodococcus sp. T7]KAF0966713.1 putative enoyl-CoA hydratase echA12 [Rhodococcus sp. T7]
MHYTEIEYAVADGTATITLHRPEKLNAFTYTMARELVAACDLADSDDSVRAVVVTGSGRAFCAGADLDPDAGEFDKKQYDGEFFDDGSPRDGGGYASLRIAAMRKPVIGAINGPAIGIGSTLTLPMDIRIASENARFGFVFTRRCLTPEAASTWFLPRLVGMSRAMEWIATARLFGSAEALAGGLVSRVCPDDDLLDVAYAVAAEIGENVAPVAFAAAKQMLWGTFESGSPWAAHRLESQVLGELIDSADFAEGVAAFLERRTPKFTLSADANVPAAVTAWPRLQD